MASGTQGHLTAIRAVRRVPWPMPRRSGPGAHAHHPGRDL